MGHEQAMADALADRFANEAQFTNWVIAVYRINGWLVTHMHDSRKQHWSTNKGIPDIIAVHPVHRRIHFLELKTKKGKPTLGQRVWLDALERTAKLINAAADMDLLTVGIRRPADQDQIIMEAGGIAP